MISTSSRRRLARDARGVVEEALDRAAWRWNRALSLWIDTLLQLEEGGA